MRLQIDKKDFVMAANYETWGFSFFGKPKITCQCGSCGSGFKTRTYHTFYEKDKYHGSVLSCPECAKWNFIAFVFN